MVKASAVHITAMIHGRETTDQVPPHYNDSTIKPLIQTHNLQPWKTTTDGIFLKKAFLAFPVPHYCHQR
jgi:hypothetical protein